MGEKHALTARSVLLLFHGLVIECAGQFPRQIYVIIDDLFEMDLRGTGISEQDF